MSVFGIEINRDPLAYRFIVDTNTRLQVNDDIGKNPFFGRAFIRKYEGKYYGVFSMTPVYPKAYWGSLFILIPAFILKWKWLYIPGLALLSLGFFWSKYFYYVIIRIAFIKLKYKGSKRLISTAELLDILID